MHLKILFAISLFTLLTRIVFSIYFSITIVDENSRVNLSQSQITELKIENQVLENEMAILNSLPNSKLPSKLYLDLR